MSLQCAGGASGSQPVMPPWYGGDRSPMGRAPAPGGTPPPPPPSQDTNVTLRAMDLTRSSSTQLQITTKEGDVVTITGSSTFEAMVGSLRYQDRGPDGAYRQRARFEQISRSTGFSISVEGDLNADELKDIHRLMARLRPAFRSASPRAGTAAALRVDGSKLDSLSGFALNQERSVTRTWLQASGTAGQAPGAPDPPAPRDPLAPQTAILA